jgi:radical SAM protein with 4Fe4S-binding SPASM domain
MGEVKKGFSEVESKYKFGNIKNEHLMEIWNKPEFVQVRKDVLNGKFDLPICKYCDYKNIKEWRETNVS